MTQWFRCFWDEESVWYYFEVGDDGYVVRQVELAEPSGQVLVATSLPEWRQAHDLGHSADQSTSIPGAPLFSLGPGPPVASTLLIIFGPWWLLSMDSRSTDVMERPAELLETVGSC